MGHRPLIMLMRVGLCLAMVPPLRWSGKTGENWVLTSQTHGKSPTPSKRPRSDAAFRAEALRLASQSRSTPPAARALNIAPKRRYAWQQAAQPPQTP
ncbi:MAG: hypothetical protein EOO63_04575 [Hymenobacter sp.]|nr:MAG: hypothetical protein EOO63_04575 [Hymenobacter sp.]